MQEATSREALALSKEQFEWAKGAYEKDSKITEAVSSQLLESMRQQAEAYTKDRARYEGIFQPLEDKLVADAESYASPERQADEAQRASAQVSQQFEAARQAAQQQLESYGINPAATRYGALDLGTRVAEAAAKAQASNEARRTTEATGRALRAEAINIGRGMPAQAAQAAAGAASAGTGAAGVTNAGTSTGASTMGTGPQWMSAGQQGLASWGNTMTASYQNQLDRFQAGNQLSPFGQLLGMGAGMAFKKFGFDKGGPVKPDMSPSKGVIPDDVPAKMSVGEYVIPEDVVSWYGEKHFRDLTTKSREARNQVLPVD